jgi:hypothetical protein
MGREGGVLTFSMGSAVMLAVTRSSTSSTWASVTHAPVISTPEIGPKRISRSCGYLPHMETGAPMPCAMWPCGSGDVRGGVPMGCEVGSDGV